MVQSETARLGCPGRKCADSRDGLSHHDRRDACPTPHHLASLAARGCIPRLLCQLPTIAFDEIRHALEGRGPQVLRPFHIAEIA